ncbi:MAG: hypothetical protein SFY81_13960 [Verrucomicrobiota bacterium]|nr:hypothetical protein [Verrucomicrobiota bacterium]
MNLIRILLLVCLIPFSGSALAAAEPSSWDYFATVGGSVGYSDNVLHSEINHEKSAFIRGMLDASLFRLPYDSNEFTFFLTLEDKRYLSSDTVNKEQLLLAQADYKYGFANGWIAGIKADYLYYDQVVDVSITTTNLESLPLKSHTLGLTPILQKHWQQYFLELELPAARQNYESPLDDTWEWGEKLRFGRKYGHRSETSLAFSWRKRFYDEREQLELDSSAIPDSSLEFTQQEIELELRHNFDSRRRCRGRFKAGYLFNRDNGPGYFDYDRFRLTAGLTWRWETGEVSLSGRYVKYSYQNQTIQPPDPPLRRRSETGAGFRAEQKIWKELSAFGEYNYELGSGNHVSDEYQAHIVETGFYYEF